MAVLNADDIADLVAGTLKELGRMKFQQIAQNLTHYEVFSKWFVEDKVQFDGGHGIQRTLMNTLSNQAKHVGLFSTDSVNVPDLIDQLSIPWRHAQTAWAFEFRETLMNRGKEMIFNIIKPRRVDAMISLVEELENKAWALPGATNKTDPYGIPYYIVKNATEGFNGGLPSGHSTVAGVSLTDSPTFKNYTGQYAAVSKQDLIKKLRTAKRKCKFVSPITIDDYRGKTGNQFRLYMNEETLSSMEDLGEAQNDNLGTDLAPMDGSMTFRKHPLRYVPKLDEDTSNPVYGIDHSTFMPVCLKGDYLREGKAKPAPNQHNVFQIFVDLSYNYLCLDRRRNWVFYV